MMSFFGGFLSLVIAIYYYLFYATSTLYIVFLWGGGHKYCCHCRGSLMVYGA